MNTAATADRFRYDAETHSYFIDGRRVPSVTEALWVVNRSVYEGIPDAVMERARDRGTRLAAAINEHNRGTLNVAALDPQTLAGVEAWCQFLEDTNATVVESETPVFHAGLGYGGTPDCVLAVKNYYLLPDVKATHDVPDTVGAQTVAYARAWTEKYYGRSVRRACVHIRNGKYSLIPRHDPGDWSLFVSCLNVVKFLERVR